MACNMDEMYKTIIEENKKKIAMIAENQFLKEAMNAKRNKLNRLKLKNKKLLCQLDQTNEKRDQLTEEKCNLEAHFNAQDKKAKQSDQYREEVRNLKDVFRQMKQEVKEAKNDGKDLKSQERELEACQQQKQCIINDLEVEKQERHDELCKLHDCKTEVVQERNEIVRALDDTLVEKGKVVMLIYEVNKIIKEEERDHEYLMKRCECLKENKEHIEKEIEWERKRIKERKKELEKIHKNIGELQVETLELKESRKVQMSKLNCVTHGLEKTRTHITCTEAKYNQLLKAIRYWKEQLASASSQGTEKSGDGVEICTNLVTLPTRQWRHQENSRCKDGPTRRPERIMRKDFYKKRLETQVCQMMTAPMGATRPFFSGCNPKIRGNLRRESEPIVCQKRKRFVKTRKTPRRTTHHGGGQTSSDCITCAGAFRLKFSTR